MVITRQVAIAGGATIENLLAQERARYVPPEMRGAVLNLAAVVQRSDNGTELDVDAYVYVGTRSVVEIVRLGNIAADRPQDGPRMPDDVLIAAEPGLPGELIQITVVNRTSGQHSAGTLRYRLEIDEV